MSDSAKKSPEQAEVRGITNKAALALLRASLKVSPRPMALVFRKQFAENGKILSDALMKRAPTDIVAVIDESYDSDPDALLDVYVPASAAKPGVKLPTVVWTHGGAFLGGGKREISGYLRIIADAGFTVVGVRYSLAPERTYPTPIRQVMAALRHLQENAERLHIDPTHLMLAGDSAGAQISAQLAAMITNSGYAQQVGIAPTFGPEQLCGVALCCGVYDFALVDHLSPFKNFLLTTGWAYSGTRDFKNNRDFVSGVSVINHVTENFPPAFITAGNADPLGPQSTALASVLESKGVDVETLFYLEDHEPPLGHEYQFDLEHEESRIALERLVAFFTRCAELSGSQRNGLAKF